VSQAIVHFHELKVDKSALSALSNEEVAIYGMLSHISNELNVFSNLLSTTRSSAEYSNPVSFAKILQHNVLLRTLSANLYEALDFLDDLRTKPKGVSEELDGILSRYYSRTSKLKKSIGYSINRNIRNEVASHYNYSDAKRNARAAQDDLDASVYLSSKDGNTYFVFGEQLMFVQRLIRFSEANAKYKYADTLAEDWLGWSLKVVKLFKDLNAEVFGFVTDKLENHEFRKTHYFVEQNMMIKNGAELLPLFVEG
jgi:hypothetical protein